MNRESIITFLMALVIIPCACSSQRRIDGWYPIADFPDNAIVGQPLVTVDDFEKIDLHRDTFVVAGDTVTQMFIQGYVKPDKREVWADGKRSNEYVDPEHCPLPGGTENVASYLWNLLIK